MCLITVRVLMWPPSAKLPQSAPVVLNRMDMSRFTVGDILRGLPARGRSVTFPFFDEKAASVVQ